MKNDLENLADIINTIHKGISGKDEMLPTHSIDLMFREIRMLVEQQFVIGKKRVLKYLDRHIDIALKLHLVVEMTIKHLDKLVPLSTLDFYRLMRCRKIEKDLMSLLDFYRAKRGELQIADHNENLNVVDLDE